MKKMKKREYCVCNANITENIKQDLLLLIVYGRVYQNHVSIN